MDFVGNFADAFDEGQDPIAGAVGHIEADDIHAGGDQLGKSFTGFRGWPHGGDDFCVSVMAAHEASG
jgi:hypothetical protein